MNEKHTKQINDFAQSVIDRARADGGGWDITAKFNGENLLFDIRVASYDYVFENYEPPFFIEEIFETINKKGDLNFLVEATVWGMFKQFDEDHNEPTT